MINKILRYLCKDKRYTNMDIITLSAAITLNFVFIDLEGCSLSFFGLAAAAFILFAGGWANVAMKEKLENQDDKA